MVVAVNTEKVVVLLTAKLSNMDEIFMFQGNEIDNTAGVAW